MKQFLVKPEILMIDSCEEFCREFGIGSGDLILSNEYIYEPYLSRFIKDANVIFVEKYGTGEPSDEMVEAIYRDIAGRSYQRVIAVGGGTIIDISKLFALKDISPVVDLYDHKIPAIRDKELYILPTTCGTGSEVTNISILELKSKHTKMGLAEEALFADKAVLIPELLAGLPFRFFATSSIDALIHAVESYLSPKASDFTRMYSERAMEMILNGYKKIAEEGEEARIPLLADFHLASTYAGIAFGNAGCAAVHALSYPLGAAYHVAHGESNYAIFTEVLKTYMRLRPEGSIQALNEKLAGILKCDKEVLYDELEKLLNTLIPKKALHEYGVKKEELREFTESVMTGQGRLMANNYTELTEETVYAIYERLY